MERYFNHKIIFYAIAICIAVIAAYKSPWLFLLLLAYCLFLRYKRWKWLELVALIVVSTLFYWHSAETIKEIMQPVQLPAKFIMTPEYKVNGNRLRGFMKGEGGRKFYVVYEIKSAQEKAYLESKSFAGMEFFVIGEIVEPNAPAHDYSFSMASYLISKNTRGIVEAEALYEAGYAHSLSSALAKRRFQVNRHIEQLFPESLVAEAQALLIGVQDDVDEELTRAYQKLGITHLFAISGLHVALVSFLFFQLLLRINVRRELATIVLLVILPVYALLAGGAPSVWRAVTVVELVLLAKYIRIKLTIDDALALSFIVFVFLQPGSVFQIGFQLSYLATTSLIFSSDILARQSNMWWQSFMMTVVCQLLVYPLLLSHFFELSLSSFVANVLFVPLFSFIILPINVALLMLSYLPGPLFAWSVTVYEPLRAMLTDAILYLQSLPYQLWIPGRPALFFIVLLYISVFIALYMLDCRRKWISIVLVLLIPAAFLQATHYINSDVKITFINVGQGDSILIELPHRKATYLIDTGGVLRLGQEERWKARKREYEVGAQVVVPLLKGKGITRLDALLLTHADADHVEGAEEILREVHIDEIWVSPNSANKEVMAPLLQDAAVKNVPIVEKLAGERWQIGDVFFQFLWPTETEYEGNNDSLVLFMQQGNFRALFTGDLELEGEMALLNMYKSPLEKIDLLKAGHHGSKTSSAEPFVAHLQPKLTVFMAGVDNRYGHPHKEVVERFTTRNLSILTTGEDGTITVTIQDGYMYVERQK